MALSFICEAKHKRSHMNPDRWRNKQLA